MQDLVGRVLNDTFEIISFIGEGGMSYVYEAIDKKLDRSVAIKRFKRNINRSTDDNLKEARTLAKLDHKNIISVYTLEHADIDGESILYMVMKLVKGGTLKQYLDVHNPLSTDDIIRLSGQIFDALTYLHSQNVIHLDLKPENILIDHGEIKLTDFGISRIVATYNKARTGLGTPLYMAPEQDDGEDIGFYTDVYSLGIILHQLITGKIPKSDTNSGDRNLKLSAEIEPELKAVIATATDSKRNNRYQTIEEFRIAFLAALDEQTSESITQTNTTKHARLYGVPSVPLTLIHRDIPYRQLQTATLDLPTENKAPIICLQGMGGMGKTTLISKLCHDDEIRARYPDGIFWVTAGKQPLLSNQMADIARSLGEANTHFNTDQYASSRLNQLLIGKSTLIILDDIWEQDIVDLFRFHEAKSTIVFTTRDRVIGESVGAEIIELSEFASNEAISLLEAITSKTDNLFAEISKQVGNLPLAIRIIGSLLNKGMSTEEWLREANSISNMRMSRNTQDPHENLKICFELSLNVLSDDRNYVEMLAIFPEDVEIPKSFIRKFWQHRDTNLSGFNVEEILREIHRLSIGYYDKETDTISFHDLMKQYLRELVGDDLQKLHQELLAMFQETYENWYSIDDPYLIGHLSHHLIEAGQPEILLSLLTNNSGWYNLQHNQSSGAATLRDISRMLDSNPAMTPQNLFELQAIRGLIYDSANLTSNTQLKVYVRLGEVDKAMNVALLRTDPIGQMSGIIAVASEISDATLMEFKDDILRVYDRFSNKMKDNDRDEPSRHNIPVLIDYTCLLFRLNELELFENLIYDKVIRAIDVLDDIEFRYLMLDDHMGSHFGLKHKLLSKLIAIHALGYTEKLLISDLALVINKPVDELVIQDENSEFRTQLADERDLFQIVKSEDVPLGLVDCIGRLTQAYHKSGNTVYSDIWFKRIQDIVSKITNLPSYSLRAFGIRQESASDTERTIDAQYFHQDSQHDYTLTMIRYINNMGLDNAKYGEKLKQITQGIKTLLPQLEKLSKNSSHPQLLTLSLLGTVLAEMGYVREAIKVSRWGIYVNDQQIRNHPVNIGKAIIDRVAGVDGNLEQALKYLRSFRNHEDRERISVQLLQYMILAKRYDDLYNIISGIRNEETKRVAIETTAFELARVGNTRLAKNYLAQLDKRNSIQEYLEEPVKFAQGILNAGYWEKLNILSNGLDQVIEPGRRTKFDLTEAQEMVQYLPKLLQLETWADADAYWINSRDMRGVFDKVGVYLYKSDPDQYDKLCELLWQNVVDYADYVDTNRSDGIFTPSDEENRHWVCMTSLARISITCRTVDNLIDKLVELPQYQRDRAAENLLEWLEVYGYMAEANRLIELVEYPEEDLDELHKQLQQIREIIQRDYRNFDNDDSLWTIKHVFEPLVSGKHYLAAIDFLEHEKVTLSDLTWMISQFLNNVSLDDDFYNVAKGIAKIAGWVHPKYQKLYESMG